jgi:hypothetical protein
MGNQYPVSGQNFVETAAPTLLDVGAAMEEQG